MVRITERLDDMTKNRVLALVRLYEHTQVIDLGLCEQEQDGSWDVVTTKSCYSISNNCFTEHLDGGLTLEFRL